MTVKMTRAEFLKMATMATLGLASSAYAASNDNLMAAPPFHWGRMKFDLVEEGNGWDVHPIGDSYLLQQLKKSTNINVDSTWHIVLFDDINEMCKYPMLFMTAEGNIHFSDTYKRNIKEYLERGGFLYADDCVLRINGYKTGSHFFKGFIRTMEEVFNTRMERIPNNHPMYHCLYDLNDGTPFMQGDNLGGYGLFLNDRLAAFATPGDIHCGWASAIKGSRGEGHWFSPKQEDDALKFTLNMVTYAMSR